MVCHSMSLDWILDHIVGLSCSCSKRWVVLLILRHFNNLSVIMQRPGSSRCLISGIEVARPGIEPRTPCSATKLLNHYTTSITYVTNYKREKSILNTIRNIQYITICKIHLWRHSIVLALHYFQGMACYRSATLLEVMDTRSFWIMFVFSRVIYLRSCISEVHSNNTCFSIN